MKIFWITLDGEQPFAGAEHYYNHIVVAKYKETAIALCKEKAADEGPEAWNNADVEEIGNYTGKESEAFILTSEGHFYG